MPRIECGNSFIAFERYYGYPVISLEIALPNVIFQPDYHHLEWLSEVWGFEWHKRWSDELPF
jgi:hypothetical protein